MGSGLFKPKNPILGADIAGRVESTGRNITRFKPGDEMHGDLSYCGWRGTEFVCANENSLAPKPSGVSFEDAAAAPKQHEQHFRGSGVPERFEKGRVF
jgi:NADPH:quinone reductase-like Zn-dependent oxidoreductase